MDRLKIRISIWVVGVMAFGFTLRLCYDSLLPSAISMSKSHARLSQAFIVRAKNHELVR